MQTAEMNSQAILTAAAQLSPDEPIFMVNLLQYRERADYGERTDFAPCTGREAYYQRYVPAFQQVTSADGIEVFWLGSVLARLVAPAEEQWHDVAIVQYPNFSIFKRAVESPEYLAQADPHRQAALADWRLIATAKVDLPK